MSSTSVWIVFAAATLTAVATGLGALPFVFVRNMSTYWTSIANAVAAGLMLAATHSLVAEGVALDTQRLILGMLLGLAGILAARHSLGEGAHIEIANLKGLDAKRAILIIAVMTAHSFAEGVGVGVSFGGSNELATFITTAIAIHNIPEGLAIALVLVPLGTPVWQAALWGIFTSLPQPLAAVPAFLAVSTFAPLLPIGFGVAAGAMMWMVFAELVPDANKHAPANSVAIAITLAFAAMIAFQYLVLKG